MGSDKSATRGGALVDQIQRRQRDTLVAAAKAKLSASPQQQLTSRELSALRAWEAEQLVRFGRAYLAAMPKADYSDIVGRQSKQLIELARKYQFPYPAGRKDPVDVNRILRWFHDFLATNAALLSSGGGDDPVLHLASGKLKDEYVRKCIEQKEIDNERKTVELANLVESNVPIDDVRDYHNKVADRLRKVRETLAKKLNGESLELAERIYDNLIDDLEKTADAFFNHIEFDESEHEAPTASEPVGASAPS
jgi:hypothetical protein